MEVLFLLGGGVLVVYFRTRAEGQFWFGLGITLGMQAAILFGADYMGAQRAAVYTKGLEAFTAKLG
jgi:hypothetical protein